MKEIQLKGYIIIAHPQQLLKNGQWTVNISIEKRRAGSVTNRQFSAANNYPTKEEATEHCLNFGKQIIDGQAEGCTVADL
jgi:hypothetical protein